MQPVTSTVSLLNFMLTACPTVEMIIMDTFAGRWQQLDLRFKLEVGLILEFLMFSALVRIM